MNHAAPPLPDRVGVAFKEWAGIVSALADGRQNLILRKGGIAEGPGGFTPEHPAFWLYPTQVHEAEQGLRATEPPPDPATLDAVFLRALAVVELIHFVDRPERLATIADLHVWSEETVSRRFHYRRPGLWVLGVRVFARSEPIAIAVTPEHAGCKTWVPLDPPPGTDGLSPVLGESDHARALDRLREALTLDG